MCGQCDGGAGEVLVPPGTAEAMCKVKSLALKGPCRMAWGQALKLLCKKRSFRYLVSKLGLVAYAADCHLMPTPK